MFRHRFVCRSDSRETRATEIGRKAGKAGAKARWGNAGRGWLVARPENGGAGNRWDDLSQRIQDAALSPE